jgi:hypothetical protein
MRLFGDPLLFRSRKVPVIIQADFTNGYHLGMVTQALDELRVAKLSGRSRMPAYACKHVSVGLDWTVLSRSRWPDHGLFGHGPNRLYVHRGTGFYGFPLRIGVPGELSVLEVLPGAPHVADLPAPV